MIARLATHQFIKVHTLREPGMEPGAVRKVREWLDAHPERNVSLKFLADLVGLSEFYLVRAFHKQIGIPPHQYQTNVRARSAVDTALVIMG